MLAEIDGGSIFFPINECLLSTSFCKIILPLKVHHFHPYQQKGGRPLQGYRNVIVVELSKLPGDRIPLTFSIVCNSILLHQLFAFVSWLDSFYTCLWIIMMAAALATTPLPATSSPLPTRGLGLYRNGEKRTSLCKQPDGCQVLLWQHCKIHTRKTH